MISIILRLLFGYFSLMTYVFIIKTLISDPGYVPDVFKVPARADKMAPLELVRIYNMRSWIKNGIHDFQKDLESAALKANSSSETEDSTTGASSAISDQISGPKLINPN